jgi:glycosyltransferase involved in cell wall biosynthesis
MTLPPPEYPDFKRRVRLAYLVSHPIQYQAPLLRRIAKEPDIDLTVFFGSDFSVREYKDEGFGVGVKWDVPLLDGYRHEFLPKIRDNGKPSVISPLNYGIATRLAGKEDRPCFDALWVHGYSTLTSLEAIVAAKSLGIPVLLRAESWLHDRARTNSKLLAKRIYFKLLKQFVDAVFAIGTFNSNYWQHYFGHDFPIFLMPYAVDNSYFQLREQEARPHRAALQMELNLDPSRPVILFASKLQRRKRCADLLNAYTRLLSQNLVSPHPYLVIVGDGEERASLERTVAERSLDGVRFCGFRNQSELPRFFDLASVFVLPSQHEPWGLIVNEVMNAGRAVIVSSDVGCQPDLVRNGIEGFVYPVGDVPALTVALSKVLANPETTVNIGMNARNRINQWSFEEDIVGLRQALAVITRKIIA